MRGSLKGGIGPAFGPDVTQNVVTPELLAHGGIVTKPTLSLIGEAGPEAVIPLSKMNTSSPKIELHFHGDINTEIDFENKVSAAFSKAAQGGAFEDFGVGA